MTLTMNAAREDVGTAAERAAAGAKWLDGIKTNWFRLIKVNNLDEGSGVDCVLAQVTKQPFTMALEWFSVQLELSLEDPTQELELLERAVDYGFRMNGTDDREELSLAWAAEIAARRERKSQPQE